MTRFLLCLPLALALALAAIAADREHLFNGRNLDGWTMVGPGRFVLENGQLKTEGGMGLLYYNRAQFGDCTIRVVFKVGAGRGNSGVFIRMAEPPPDAWYGVHNGYEVQIDSGGDEWHATGALILALAAHTLAAHAQDKVIVSHGISTFGDLKLPADFTHLPYVNPDAPKGGISGWLANLQEKAEQLQRDAERKRTGRQ